MRDAHSSFHSGHSQALNGSRRRVVRRVIALVYLALLKAGVACEGVARNASWIESWLVALLELLAVVFNVILCLVERCVFAFVVPAVAQLLPF